MYPFLQVLLMEIMVILSSNLPSCSIKLISSLFYKTTLFYLIFKQGFKLFCCRVGLTQCYIQFSVIIVFFHCRNPIHLLYLVQGWCVPKILNWKFSSYSNVCCSCICWSKFFAINIETYFPNMKKYLCISLRMLNARKETKYLI